MQNIPAPIRIISVWLIFSGAVSFLINLISRDSPAVTEIMSRNPLPIYVQVAWVYTGASVSLVSGIAMLHGRNWARFLYLAWTGATLLVSFATSPVKAASMPGLVSFLVIAPFLFFSKSVRYFTEQKEKEGAGNFKKPPGFQ